VRERTFEHIADDFHIAVAVRAKARAGGNPVFVDHAQIAEPHMARVVVTGKRKAVIGLEPAVVGVAAFLGFAQSHHGVLPFVQVTVSMGSTVEVACQAVAERR
jgi:hypothetical protein